MARDIYLISYDSPLLPAHWSLWIPRLDDATLGTRIHVTGDVFTGFTHEFVRQYNTTTDGRKYKLTLLARIDNAHVVDALDRNGCDTDAVDNIERIALSVPAPGKSLNAAADVGPRGRVHVQNCQTWMFQLVDALIAANVFPESALDVLRTAPRN